MMPSYIHTMWYILATNLKLLTRTIVDKLIDMFIWLIVMSIVTIYLLPAFGIEASYGAFLIASMAASGGVFEQFSSTVQLLSDFEGNQVISFYFMLPMPSWLVLLTYMIFYAINTFVICFGVIPVSKLIFWNHFSLEHFSIAKYGLMLLLTSLFYGAFTLWLAGMVKNIERIGNAWMRFIFPMWTFGGFQYSYNVLFDMSPFFARLSLINPQLYIMEGTRAAILGQQGSLNIWLCAGMILIFTVLFAAHAIYLIKKRLDFV